MALIDMLAAKRTGNVFVEYMYALNLYCECLTYLILTHPVLLHGNCVEHLTVAALHELVPL